MNVMLLLLRIMPQLVALIKAAEVAHPEAGQGQAKLNTVLDSVETIVATVPQVAEEAHNLRATAAPLIAAAVGVFNALGHFKGERSAAGPQ